MRGRTGRGEDPAGLTQNGKEATCLLAIASKAVTMLWLWHVATLFSELSIAFTCSPWATAQRHSKPARGDHA
jgi:hypothetical protein